MPVLDLKSTWVEYSRVLVARKQLLVHRQGVTSSNGPREPQVHDPARKIADRKERAGRLGSSARRRCVFGPFFRRSSSVVPGPH